MSTPTKAELRDHAKIARRSLTDRPERSQRIFAHLTALPAYQVVKLLLFYIDARGEVETQAQLQHELATGRSIAVPYCVGDELQLFRLFSMQELVRGAFNILEPAEELRREPRRLVLPAEVDVALVPGVVFDLQGNRLGYGRGYYDRLLAQFPATALRIGLAFDCQVVAELPHEPHDQPLDWLVTESGLRVIRG